MTSEVSLLKLSALELSAPGKQEEETDHFWRRLQTAAYEFIFARLNRRFSFFFNQCKFRESSGNAYNGGRLANASFWVLVSSPSAQLEVT